LLQFSPSKYFQFPGEAEVAAQIDVTVVLGQSVLERRPAVCDQKLANLAGFLFVGAGCFRRAFVARLEVPAGEIVQRLAGFAAVLAFVDGDRCGDVVSPGKGIVGVKH
jgi:hypothetical protein